MGHLLFSKNERRNRLVFSVFLVALVLLRFYKFQPVLEEPHILRQAYTASYSLGFYKYDRNILYPSVNWLGEHRHLILECPLPEWIAALLYHATGPTILVDRALTILAFLGSAFFFHGIVRLAADRLMAQAAVLLYMSVPLGIFYSRAVHVDPWALLFAHGMLYYAMRFTDTGRTRHMSFAALAGSLGFLIKAPYVFFLALPAAYYALKNPGFPRKWVKFLLIFAVPTLLFLLWRLHVEQVNSSAPDWDFLPGYFKAVDMGHWYYGEPSQRFSAYFWGVLGRRLYSEIAAGPWILLLPAALPFFRGLRRYALFALVWTLGSAVYLLVFFMLNVIHNYYQLPFLAVFSLWGAVFFRGMARRSARFRAFAGMLLLLFMLGSASQARRDYYKRYEFGERAGEFIRRHTVERDLVVLSVRDHELWDNRLLYYADRLGWTVKEHAGMARTLELLRREGATVYVTDRTSFRDKNMPESLKTMRLLSDTPSAPGKIRIYRMAAP